MLEKVNNKDKILPAGNQIRHGVHVVPVTGQVGQSGDGGVPASGKLSIRSRC